MNSTCVHVHAYIPHALYCMYNIMHVYMHVILLHVLITYNYTMLTRPNKAETI